MTTKKKAVKKKATKKKAKKKPANKTTANLVRESDKIVDRLYDDLSWLSASQRREVGEAVAEFLSDTESAAVDTTLIRQKLLSGPRLGYMIDVPITFNARVCVMARDEEEAWEVGYEALQNAVADSCLHTGDNEEPERCLKVLTKGGEEAVVSVFSWNIEEGDADIYPDPSEK